jgi:hypothetical protein
VALVAALALTRQWLTSLTQLLIMRFVASPDVTSFYAETIFLAIALVIFLYYFFGARLVCVKWLLGRMLYYEALSEIVWYHMGTNIQGQSIGTFMQLRDRAVKMGVSQAVISLFEANLSVSLWYRKHSKVDLGDKQNETLKDQLQKSLRKPFNITDDSICWVTQKYYDHPAPLWRRWNRADLLLIAYRYALDGYRRDMKRYVEDLENAAANSA